MGFSNRKSLPQVQEVQKIIYEPLRTSAINSARIA